MQLPSVKSGLPFCLLYFKGSLSRRVFLVGEQQESIQALQSFLASFELHGRY
jgi:hypothetical protein